MPTPTLAPLLTGSLKWMLACLVVWSVSSTEAADAQALSVSWTGQRVNIVAEQVSLSSVLTELARRTGARVAGLDAAADVITVDIRDALLVDAVRALLAETKVNYVFTLRLPSGTESVDRLTLWLHQPSASRAYARVQPVDIFDGAETPSDLQAGPVPVVDEVTRLNADGAFGAGATEASLIGLTTSPSHEVRILALQTLALQSTKGGLQALQAALEDEHPFVRAEAMNMLISQSPGVAAVSRLGGLLAHEDPNVRGVAAMALGEQAGADADFLLRRALYDESPSVKALAGEALKQKQHEHVKR